MEEAERLCDSLAIIDHGHLIATGTVAELSSQLDARDVLQLSGFFPVDDTKRAISGLAENGGLEIEVISLEEDGLTLTLASASQHLPGIFGALSEHGCRISETSLRSPNLETVFLLLTGKELRE